MGNVACLEQRPLQGADQRRGSASHGQVWVRGHHGHRFGVPGLASDFPGAGDLRKARGRSRVHCGVLP